MDKSEVAIATISWARNDGEEILLRESFTQLSKLKIPVFITDGGSSESFLQTIRNIPYLTLLEPVKGLWGQARNSLYHAYEKNLKFVFYTEPDKHDFFAHSLPRMLNEIHVDDESGIYLASRSDEGFSSFPLFQQMTETTINNCCHEVIGERLDYVYGPFLMTRNIIPYLAKLEQNIGWGWRPYAFNLAKRLGYRVEAFTGDFLCPVDQRIDSPAERIYRMKQLTQNIEGLTLSAVADLYGQSSGLHQENNTVD